MKTLPKHRPHLGFKSGAMALALATFALTACQTPDNNTGTAEPNQPTADQTTTDQQAENVDRENIQIGDLTGRLEDYVGQTVSVRGEVVEVIGDNAFVIRRDELFGGDDVVVFNTTGSPVVLPGDNVTERLQVTGDVQQVVLSDLAQQGGLTLDEETYGDYEDGPAIVAESIVLAPEPNEISDNPEAFYDQVIAVEGEIGEQYDDNTFTISQAQFLGGADVLVVGEDPSIATISDDNNNVVITGVLRPFNADELERDYNLTWDENLRQTIESDYSEEPIFIAEQVFPFSR